MTQSITIGVIADTHVPDRIRHLHPAITSIFKKAEVHAILHAGDITVPRAIDHLAEIAPVHAVRGNRDSLRLRHLPLTRTLQFGQVEIGLTHGHKDWPTYLRDRLRFLSRGGLPFDYIVGLVRGMLPTARVIVFGHIHLPMNRWMDGQLLFNPGSATRPISPNLPPTIGLIRIKPEGEVEAEIVYLPRLQL